MTSDLVNHDERGSRADDAFEKPGAGRNLVLIALLRQLVAGSAAQPISQLSPKGVGCQLIIFMVDANTGIKIGAHYPHYVRIARLKQQLLISHHVPDVFDTPERVDRMIEGDEVVGLAATK